MLFSFGAVFYYFFSVHLSENFSFIFLSRIPLSENILSPSSILVLFFCTTYFCNLSFHHLLYTYLQNKNRRPFLIRLPLQLVFPHHRHYHHCKSGWVVFFQVTEVAGEVGVTLQP